MDFKKCQRIFDELDTKHRTTPILDKYGRDLGIKQYTTSARGIEVDVYNMWLKGEITEEEYYCIFGMICRNALHVGGTDFYRI